MLTICDTHILLFWADQPERLSSSAAAGISAGLEAASLACSGISLWEIAMLYSKGRINNHAGISATDYIQTILTAMAITVLPINPDIAGLSQSPCFIHGDPADRLIGATALAYQAPLITADEKLHVIPGLRCIW
ncbi:MAG: PIN domain nuclease [Methylobacter sp.]|nr:MAG: PIN domain nuclease [Methylobacter sp.]PPD03045.1 MAG: PIN domain nuclease [Methylobacter sp.]PPD37160.1 MAG: PIN domain nuclease [Methylomonas sp.]